jgi:hypothetical protein
VGETGVSFFADGFGLPRFSTGRSASAVSASAAAGAGGPGETGWTEGAAGAGEEGAGGAGGTGGVGAEVEGGGDGGVDAGAASAGLGFCGARRKIGGASSSSSPRGLDSALWGLFAALLPAGSHVPAAVQLLLAPSIALVMVNNPSELPARSAS